jgi:hypothetical protein
MLWLHSATARSYKMHVSVLARSDDRIAAMIVVNCFIQLILALASVHEIVMKTSWVAQACWA